MPKVKYHGSHKIELAFSNRVLKLAPGDPPFECSELEACQLASDDAESKKKGRCLKWLIEKPKPAPKGKE